MSTPIHVEDTNGTLSRITIATGDMEDNVITVTDTPIIGISIQIREHPLRPTDEATTAFLGDAQIKALREWINRRYPYGSQDGLTALADAGLDEGEEPADAFLLGYEAGRSDALVLTDREARAALDMWNDVISDCDDGVVGMQKAFTEVAERRKAVEQ